VDGVSEIVKDNNNGFLIRPRDVEQLANRIVRYIDNKELVLLHSQRGREFIKDKWSIEDMVDKIDKIYQDLIQEKIKK
jgi:glycosyltransferase involved in cell wall biosynthesis